MRRWLLACLFCFFLFPVEAVWAQTPTSEKAASCEGGKATSVADRKTCAALGLWKAQGEMKAAYEKIQSRIDTEGKRRLKSAYKAWEKYRDTQCAFELLYSSSSGTLLNAIQAECFTRMTQAQTEFLKRYVGCAEDDPSCTPK